MSRALEKPVLIDKIHAQAAVAPLAGDEPSDYDDGLLGVAGPIMLICYALMFVIATVTFASAGDALFVVVISTFFGIVFFAIPIVFLRIRAGRDRRWEKNVASATAPDVDVWTGAMHRWEAIVQIVSIPLAVLMGFGLLAIRWSLL